MCLDFQWIAGQTAIDFKMVVAGCLVLAGQKCAV